MAQWSRRSGGSLELFGDVDDDAAPLVDRGARGLLHLLTVCVGARSIAQARRVNAHAVADGLLPARRDRRVPELVVDLAHERVGLLRERRLDEPAELPSREVCRRGLIALDLRIEA